MLIFATTMLPTGSEKGMTDDEALTHRWLTMALETRRQGQARNSSSARTSALDDVMNAQREEIYRSSELRATRGRFGHHRRLPATLSPAGDPRTSPKRSIAEHGISPSS